MSQIRPHHSFLEFSKNAKKFSIHADVAKYSTESAKNGCSNTKNFFKPWQNTKSNGNLADENRIKTQNHQQNTLFKRHKICRRKAKHQMCGECIDVRVTMTCCNLSMNK